MTDRPADNFEIETRERRLEPRHDAERAGHHDAIYTLARASELHDPATGDHVLRIRFAVDCLARALGFDADDAEALGYDAMLHDVGKLEVPPEILRKPEGLDEDERRIMQSHTLRGEALLGDRPSLQRAARIARSHHECHDGSGYPDGLVGDDIPLAARITAVADVLDALMSARAYKRAWSYERAIEEIVGLAGTQLDPVVIEALERCDRAGSLRAIYESGA